MLKGVHSNLLCHQILVVMRTLFLLVNRMSQAATQVFYFRNILGFYSYYVLTVLIWQIQYDAMIQQCLQVKV